MKRIVSSEKDQTVFLAGTLAFVLLIPQFCPHRHEQGLTCRTGLPLVKHNVSKRTSTFLGHFLGQGLPGPCRIKIFLFLEIVFRLLGLDRSSLLSIRNYRNFL